MLLPQAINNFCKELGITRSDADIHLHKLEHHVRAELEASSPRTLAVLSPLLVVLTNLPPDAHIVVKAKVGVCNLCAYLWRLNSLILCSCMQANNT